MSFKEILRRKSVDFGLTSIGKKPGCAVLMYHGIVRDASQRGNSRTLTAGELEQHFKGYRKYFHIATLDEVFAGDIPKDRFTVALTFDDGLRNNYSIAAPILEQAGVPATFFVTGANQAGYLMLWGEAVDLAEKEKIQLIDLNGEEFRLKDGHLLNHRNGENIRDHIKRTGNRSIKEELYAHVSALNENGLAGKYEEQWKLMSDEEIRELDLHSLFSIGAHGYRHLELGSVDIHEAEEDLKASRSYLESLIGRKVNTLAWPSGSYNGEVKKAAKEMGFTKQLAVDYQLNDDHDDPTILNRYGIFSFPVSERYFHYLITQHRKT